MNSIVFTLDDQDSEKFLRFLESSNDPIAKKALDNISDSNSYSLWVSGRKMSEGTLPYMRRLFQQECASHSASVVLKEYHDGKWREINSRRVQSQ